MINLRNIKKARKILSKEIQENLSMHGSKEYGFLLQSAGYLETIINIIKKKEKSKNKGLEIIEIFEDENDKKKE